MTETDDQMTKEFLLPNQETTDNGTDGPTEPDTDPDSETPEQGDEPKTVDQLPEWARKELSKARRDAAKYRNAAKEKAPAADEKSIRAQIRAEMMTEVAAAKIEAALTGIVDDPSSLVEDLDLTRYIGEEGIDEDAIEALKSKYARIVKRPGVGQGRTGKQPQGSTADQFAAVMKTLGA